jgi:hypothetical protein
MEFLKNQDTGYQLPSPHKTHTAPNTFSCWSKLDQCCPPGTEHPFSWNYLGIMLPRKLCYLQTIVWIERNNWILRERNKFWGNIINVLLFCLLQDVTTERYTVWEAWSLFYVNLFRSAMFIMKTLARPELDSRNDLQRCLPSCNVFMLFVRSVVWKT